MIIKAHLVIQDVGGPVFLGQPRTRTLVPRGLFKDEEKAQEWANCCGEMAASFEIQIDTDVVSEFMKYLLYV